MHTCNPPDALRGVDAFVLSSDRALEAANAKTEFSINELAREFDLTQRALRFYESRGLLSPARNGRRRIFSRQDRDRLALIIKGKKLGLTLTEVTGMVEAEAGCASQHGLKLTSEKCREQIAHFERQIAEANEALAELRRIDALFRSLTDEKGSGHEAS